LVRLTAPAEEKGVTSARAPAAARLSGVSEMSREQRVEVVHEVIVVPAAEIAHFPHFTFATILGDQA
jgi:hypothetical protein